MTEVSKVVRDVIVFGLVFLLGGCAGRDVLPHTQPETAIVGEHAEEDNTFQQVKVAAVSYTPRMLDLNGNANTLERLFREAAGKGAQLALAPEGCLDGYVINNILNGKDPAKRAFAVAVTIDGPVVRRFQKLARELNICLVFGFAERIDDEVYNCAVFVDNQGKLRGKYHKMQFAEGYHSSWWFNRLGKENRAFETPFGRCGFMICADRWNPTLASVPVLDGASFLLIPTYGTRTEHNDRALLARANENGVPIVQANGEGATVIISRGKIVKQSYFPQNKDPGTVTIGTIDIPSERVRDIPLRDQQEKAFLEWREKEMRRRFEANRKNYVKRWGGEVGTSNIKNSDRK